MELNQENIRRIRNALIAASGALMVSSGAIAQDNSEDPAYELSPFEVDASQDSGYRAANTLSGTRLNSSLRDTPASISVWTQEFVDDTGFTEIEDLVKYSTNTVLDVADAQGSEFFNGLILANNVVSQIRTRGINASQGIDYFKSIIPNDSYRVGRYDDSRGPNGVLFGVSKAGGLINQTSYHASLGRDSGRIRYSFGSNDRNRLEFRNNMVVAEDKFAIALAGLYQANGHWRDFASDDKKRAYIAADWRISEKITFRVNAENGKEHRTTVSPVTPMDEGLPFYDNLMAGNDVLETPDGGNPSAALQSVGVVGRDGRPGRNHRITYVVDDGYLYDNVGAYITGGYNRGNVVHPDGTPGGADRRMRINDPELFAHERFVPGPGHFRETDFDMISGFLDVTLTPDWYLNVQFATQSSDILVYAMTGPTPEFRGEPNLTRGVGGPANPYAGGLYLESKWNRDVHDVRFEELRVSTSYNLQTDSKWLGRHQIAISGARSDENDYRIASSQILGGNPAGAGTFVDGQGNRYTNSRYDHPDNQVAARRYITLGDYSTYRGGDWSEVPSTITTDAYTTGEPTEYPVTWSFPTPGHANYLADSTTDSYMAVTQSRFWDDRLIFTLGYRKDEVSIVRYGHVRDPLMGWIPTKSITSESESTADIIPGDPEVDFSGNVRTTGVVFHVNDNLSIVANESSSVGVPDFRRLVFPDARNAPPSDGSGKDFGIDFNLFNNRLNGRVVYYETEEIDSAGGGRDGSNQMKAIYDTYEEYLTGAALENLLSQRQYLRPDVNGKVQDRFSNGYELRLTANMTENWRLTMNAAYTDRKDENVYRRAQEHLGLLRGADGLVIQGATRADVPDPSGDPGSTIEAYTIDPSAYAPDGVVAAFLALEDQLPAPYNLQNTGMSEQLYEMVDRQNNRIQQEEQRWGLRPWRVNVFTAYDFDEGLLKGWSTGGGVRWNDANIIGEYDDGTEVTGSDTLETDFFIRYRTNQFSPIDGGRWTFQMNVYNVFDDTDLVPGKLARDGEPEWHIPGGRGVGYARFDVTAPREFRFTATLDY